MITQMIQEGEPLPGPQNDLLSNTRKWIVQGDTCWQSKRLDWEGASFVAQLVKNRLQCRRPGFDPWVWKIPWNRERLPTVFWPGEFHGLYSPWGCDSLRWMMLDSWCPRKIQLWDQGPSFITQELLHSRVLLKWKGDKESFWHRHQKDDGEFPPPLV